MARPARMTSRAASTRVDCTCNLSLPSWLLGCRPMVRLYSNLRVNEAIFLVGGYDDDVLIVVFCTLQTDSDRSR